jgi:DNA polymerase-4
MDATARPPTTHPGIDARAILHVDMDAFYASVEQRDDPALRGQPVVVGGSGARAVVMAASYEVRRYGVRSAMSMHEARQRCPELVCVIPRMTRYREVSRHVFAVFERYTPLVQGLSIDEAYLDVTAALARHGDIVAVGRAIKRNILDETGLKASVGMGPNKLLAKIASELDKPDGFLQIAAERACDVLDPMPVRRLNGIGPRTAERLHALGIRTLRELRLAPADSLRPLFGRYTKTVQERAAGLDDRPVQVELPDISISAEETFDQDIADATQLHDELRVLVGDVGERLRRRELTASVVRLKLRRADFSTCTRQQHFNPATDETSRLEAIAATLLSRWLASNPGVRVRLLGAGVAGLAPATQLALFDQGGDEAQDAG